MEIHDNLPKTAHGFKYPVMWSTKIGPIETLCLRETGMSWGKSIGVRSGFELATTRHNSHVFHYLDLLEVENLPIPKSHYPHSATGSIKETSSLLVRLCLL